VIDFNKIAEIDSRKNAAIKYVRSLKERKTRDRERSCILEGKNIMQEVLLAGQSLRLLLILKAELQESENRPLIEGLMRRSARTFAVGEELMAAITTMEHAPGFIAVMESTLVPPDELTVGQESFFIIIDGIQDPGNLGTIIRSGCAFGASAIIVHGMTADLFNPKTIRASAGLLLRIPCCRAEIQDLAALKKRGARFLASLSKGEKTFLDVDFSPPLALILGNESRGISEDLIALSDQTVRVPMVAGIESLNVSIAGALMSFRFFQLNRLGC
jgi:RNA methyltransferase, TrmH family